MHERLPNHRDAEGFFQQLHGKHLLGRFAHAAEVGKKSIRRLRRWAQILRVSRIHFAVGV